MAHSAEDSYDSTSVGAKMQVLTVGDWKLREFVAATGDITDARGWSSVTDIDQACQLLQNCQQPPELIFLAQPQPGLFCQEEIDRLQQLVPLTRLVIVAGSWCEGELRTGSPPSGVLRLYWYELAPWWHAAIRRRDAGQCPPWSLPLDHLQAGRWSFANDLSSDGSLLSVRIDAADYAVYETLSSALGEYNISSSWQGRNESVASPTQVASAIAAPATVGIWDGGQLNACELDRLEQFCRQTNGSVIVLLDFPRIEHLQQAEAAGAAAVFAKPYIVEEVVAAMVATLTTRPNRSAKSLAASPVRAPASNESG